MNTDNIVEFTMDGVKPKYVGRLYIDISDQDVFIALKLLDEQSAWCAFFDNAKILTVNKHYYVSTNWIKKEMPGLTKKLARVKENGRSFWDQIDHVRAEALKL